MVVTGDVTQVDLPAGTTSGLRQVRDILREVDDVHFAELDSTDVVRHRLVGAIVDAYERSGSRGERRRPDSSHLERRRPDRVRPDHDRSDRDGPNERFLT